MAHVNRLFQVIEPISILMLLCSGHCRGLLPRSSWRACLGPLAASNIAGPFSEVVYASDASTQKGGLVCARVLEELGRAPWRTANKKAKNPCLQTHTAALHRIRPLLEDEICRPVGLRWAGVVTAELSKLGVACGPVFNISFSRRFDIVDRRVFAWLEFMCEDAFVVSCSSTLHHFQRGGSPLSSHT